jgi:succinate---hydroxymethylglutarate CoA-transferase
MRQPSPRSALDEKTTLTGRPLLTGLRVLEFGQIAAGPFTGSLLADLGADVVKVERPDGGDSMRQWPPIDTAANGERLSYNFAALNRNKRSIALDMNTTQDREAIASLCNQADVLIENFRPGIMQRHGLGYPALSARNPRLVYCSISGFGQSGPYAQRGAFDVTIQAFSGLMSVTGEDGGPPAKCGVPVGDFCTGLYAALSIVAAVLRRNETGVGAYIDCSMLGSLIGIAALQTSEFFGTGHAPRRLGSAHSRNAPYQAFRANDDYFVIAAGTHKLWLEVCQEVGMPELAEDGRFFTQERRAENQNELATILNKRFALARVAEWLERFDRRGVPCAPINDYPDALDNPQIKHLGLVTHINLPNGATIQTTAFPVKITDYRFEIHCPPPALGAHTEEVFSDWLGRDHFGSATGRERTTTGMRQFGAGYEPLNRPPMTKIEEAIDDRGKERKEKPS